MNKISREALLEMAREAGIAVHPLKQQARIGIDTITSDDSTAKLERFADLVLASQQQSVRRARSCVMKKVTSGGSQTMAIMPQKTVPQLSVPEVTHDPHPQRKHVRQLRQDRQPQVP